MMFLSSAVLQMEPWNLFVYSLRWGGFLGVALGLAFCIATAIETAFKKFIDRMFS